MKKHLLKLTIICLLAFAFQQSFAQRFLTEVFPSASVTPNVTYGQNYEILTQSPVLINLTMDVYQPAGAVDPMTERPLIILLHTGSFLPTYINRTPTGSNHDSAMVEMCTRLAKRGYVVVAPYYRLGWNPQALGGGMNQDIRTGTLLSAVYRAIQDTKFCVRFMRDNALNGGNTYKIDESKIIVGGLGSGGYVALAYATLDDPAEITLDKFLSDNTVGAPYYYTAGQPYVNMAILGDYDGMGGLAGINIGNYLPGISNEVHFVVNMGGALGDSTWIAAGDVPIVAFHVISDPFAPYIEGTVIVPTTGDPVVEVIGSREILRWANQFNNNDCFANAGFTDTYTQHANALNLGYEGLYPFALPGPQAGPWEWFDSSATVAGAQLYGLTQAEAIAVYQNALLTNPDMSKGKALAYIDTIMGYLSPRIVYCLNLPTGINEVSALNQQVDVYPSPATTAIYVKSQNASEKITAIEITDIAGQSVRKMDKVNNTFYKIDRESLAPGTYFVKVTLNKNTVTRKILVR